jgi:hypothetical protein
MREHIDQSKRSNGLFGIRIGLWLVVFVAAIGCILMISLSSYDPSQLASDGVSESELPQDSSTHNTGFRRTRNMEFTPATYHSRESWDFDEAQLALINEMTQDRRTWWDTSGLPFHRP